MILTRKQIDEINLDLLADEKIKSGRAREMLLVVPTNRKLRKVKKDIINLSPGGSVSGINIETLTTLSLKMLESIKSFNELTEAASAVLLEKSINLKKLRYFSLYKEKVPAGTLERLINVISKYKQSGVTPELVREEAELLTGAEQLKALDIADIFEAYKSNCRKLNYLELGDIYFDLINSEQNIFKDKFRELYPEIDLILFSGFDEFSNPEIDLIEKISEIKDYDLYLHFDYYSFNPAVFSHLEECYEKLEARGFFKIKENQQLHSNFLDKLRSVLFLDKNNYETSFENKITKIEAATRTEEIELIGKEVKKLLLKGDTEPHKICIVFNRIDNYSARVRNYFDKLKIPVNLTDRLKLEQSPVVITVLNMLDVLENDFYHKSVFRAVSSGFTKLDNVVFNHLVNTSRNLKIVAGHRNWLSTIDNEVALNDELNKFDIEQYKSARRSIEKLYSILKPFKNLSTPDQFFEKLIMLISELKMPLILLEESGGKEEENIKAITTFIETMKEVFELLKQEHGEETEHNFEFYLNVIRTSVNRGRYNIKEKSNYGVLVTSVNEIRGLDFDYLFIGGMCDGDFPTKFSPEIFASGSFAKKELQHQTEERYHFYQALCCWRKGLYLSIPALSGDRELEESVFMKEFESKFKLKVINSEDFKDQVYTYENLFEYAGENLDLLSDEVIKEVEKITRIEIQTLKALSEITLKRFENPFEDNEFTGIIGSNEKLKNYKEREFSVSQLETYAKCPFKFFVERILKIEPEQEITEDIEAVEIGRALHSILYKFYTEIKNLGLIISGCSQEVFNKARKILFEIAREELDNNIFNSNNNFLEKEKILGLEGKEENSILYKFLETERDETEYLPKYFEMGFGSVESESEGEKNYPGVKIGNVKIRGKVDRVEINSNSKSFNVVDYKTGTSKPTFDDLWEGLSLQLPVYLAAVKEVLEKSENETFTPNEMFIYTLKYGRNDFGRKRVSPAKGRKKVTPEMIPDLIELVSGKVNEYVENISEGKFNLQKDEKVRKKVCSYCDYKSVCRISVVDN